MEAWTALGLGGNLGDVEKTFDNAVEELQKIGLQKIRRSSIIVTSPVGCPSGTPDFRNAALIGFWKGTPETLLTRCQEVEVALGRPKDHPHWVSRTLDIDLLLFGDLMVQTPILTLPHPEMIRRSFVLVPLAELVPDLVIPGIGLTVKKALALL